jgi:hypothetical protein
MTDAEHEAFLSRWVMRRPWIARCRKCGFECWAGADATIEEHDKACATHEDPMTSNPTSIVTRAREIASLSTVSSQPHVWEAMKLLVEMADEIEKLRLTHDAACRYYRYLKAPDCGANDEIGLFEDSMRDALSKETP